MVLSFYTVTVTVGFGVGVRVSVGVSVDVIVSVSISISVTVGVSVGVGVSTQVTGRLVYYNVYCCVARTSNHLRSTWPQLPEQRSIAHCRSQTNKFR